ncbi:MAG: hypothetical protein IT365_27580 [Candidatus Hydrogenedentes bacterium]|nr:hypothetical protein [Candidatus Hydrogenedentota bacterium]
MTRTDRNLRLFFILLVVIVCLYGGFLWFARSTQEETARLHAAVGERL